MRFCVPVLMFLALPLLLFTLGLSLVIMPVALLRRVRAASHFYVMGFGPRFGRAYHQHCWAYLNSITGTESRRFESSAAAGTVQW